MPVSAVLFDFDGTLVETRTASWLLFEETNRRFSLGIDTREHFFRMFDGNFFETLAAHCGDPDIARAAAADFLQLVAERYEPEFIPGIVDAVRTLSARTTLAVLSSNLNDTICRILRTGGIADCFSFVLSGDIEPSKAAAITRFLDGGFEPNPCTATPSPVRADTHVATDVVLVTDTVGDVLDGVACGLGVYGVQWGMHSEQRLLDAGAVRAFREPAEITGTLFSQPPSAEAARGRHHS